MKWSDYYVLRCRVPVLVLKLACPHHLQGWRFSENLAIVLSALQLGMATIQSPSNGFSRDLCSGPYGDFLAQVENGKIWLLSQTLLDIRKSIQQPAAGGWFLPHILIHKILYAQAYRVPQPTVLQFVQIPPASVTGTFPCCFWAFSVGSDIICYLTLT